MRLKLKKRLKLSQLQAYLAVIKCGGVTQASKDLNVTQPAVTLSVQQLERFIGGPLIEVVNKKIYPSRAGEILLQACRDIDTCLDELEVGLNYLSGGVKGQLNLAVISSAKYFIPQLMGEFIKLYPDVEPVLDFLPRQQVLEKLINNECDFAIMSQSPKTVPLVAKRFAQNPLVCIVSPDHPLAKKKKIKIKDLANEHLVVREQGSGIRAALKKLYESAAVQSKILMELSSTEAIKQIVASGIGMSLVPKLSIERELAANILIILDVENTPIKKYWHTVYPKGKKLPLIARKFADYIHENIASVIETK